MTFKLGDRVRVNTTKYDGNEMGNHFGLTGTIDYLFHEYIVPGGMVRVKIDSPDERAISYYQEDLDHLYNMCDGDLLEEITLANDIYSSLSAKHKLPV